MLASLNFSENGTRPSCKSLTRLAPQCLVALLWFGATVSQVETSSPGVSSPASATSNSAWLMPLRNFRYEELHEKRKDVAEILERQGLLTVTVAGFADIKQKAFAAIQKCAPHSTTRKTSMGTIEDGAAAVGHNRDEAGTSSMSSNTNIKIQKKSLAGAMQAGAVLAPFEGIPRRPNGEAKAACAGFHDAMRRFREVIRMATFKLVEVLDEVDNEREDESRGGRQPQRSDAQLTQLLLSAEHLEHIHRVEAVSIAEAATSSSTDGNESLAKASGSSASAAAVRGPEQQGQDSLTHDAGAQSSVISRTSQDHPGQALEGMNTDVHPLHVDAGLLLAMTNVHESDSLDTIMEVELPDGSRPRILVDNLDRILFMGGRGFNHWRVARNVQVHAVPHRVFFVQQNKPAEISTPGGSLLASRHWYGMMLLPPANFDIGREGHRERVLFEELGKMIKRGDFETAQSLACGPALALEEWHKEHRAKQEENEKAARASRARLEARDGDANATAEWLNQQLSESNGAFRSTTFLGAGRRQENGAGMITASTAEAPVRSLSATTAGPRASVVNAAPAAPVVIGTRMNAAPPAVEEFDENASNMYNPVPEDVVDEEEEQEQAGFRSACSGYGGYWCWHRCMYVKQAPFDRHKQLEAQRSDIGSSYSYVGDDPNIPNGETSLGECAPRDLQCVYQTAPYHQCRNGHSCVLQCQTNKRDNPFTQAPRAGAAVDCRITSSRLQGPNPDEAAQQGDPVPANPGEGQQPGAGEEVAAAQPGKEYPAASSSKQSPSGAPAANQQGSATGKRTPRAVPFCRGATDMHMMGFKSIFSSEVAECMMLFHQSLLLDSWWKFLLGFLFIVSFGIATEFVVSVRRNADPDLRTFKGKAYKVSLFAGNMFIGYLVMLITMTYSVELFLAVIIGLGIGHFAFNSQAPVGESVTACCAGRNNPQTLRQTLFALQEQENRNTLEGAEDQEAFLSADHAAPIFGASSSAAANRSAAATSSKRVPGDEERVVIGVRGMTCGNCERTVRNALEALNCVRQVHSVSYATQRVDCTIGHIEDKGVVAEEIESLGFLVKDKR
ncbi:unnamed protein product [Amoebophrya sp. A25]|nr:unnamed protein product [Amoebophrya sp. A25]|eukprot:GSA25T00016201001.1